MIDREIQVGIKLTALHCWPEASGHRAYLAQPHLHDFSIVARARVAHGDRDIEFHDLRDKVQAVVRSFCSYRRGSSANGSVVYDLGRKSCEDVAEGVLLYVPEVHSVTVMEDESCGATVTRFECPIETTEKVSEDWADIDVYTICGSTKFKQAWLDAMKLLEEEGVASFQVGSFMHADSVPISEEQKEFFDLIHKRKIDLSDGIYVLNVNGYVGSSTRSEIEYALRQGKAVRFLEPENVPDWFKSLKSSLEIARA